MRRRQPAVLAELRSLPCSRSPAAQGGYVQTLSSLHGTGLGGFRLYVGDDCIGGTGSISSWSFNVTFIPCAELCLVKKADAVTVNAGAPIGFTLDAYNNFFFEPECDLFPQQCDIHGVSLNDPLPSGPGID